MVLLWNSYIYKYYAKKGLKMYKIFEKIAHIILNIIIVIVFLIVLIVGYNYIQLQIS